MKDIKELIYAAVEENAVKFQELVNAQLQVRAYDAIEALRPEVGASMFGEAKKMEDDEEEMEDEDEDEEMEDEDEMDDKKKSMKEALHPNQQKIDVVDDEKIDAKDFAKLRQMKKMKEEVEQIDEAVFDSKDAAQSVANKLKTKHDDGNYHVKADNGKHRVVHAYYPNSKVKKQIAGLKEEAEQIAELSKKTTGSYLRKATIDYGRRVRRDALGHAVGGDTDVKNFVKMGDRAQGISRAIKKLTKEEVKQVNELSTDKLTNYAKAANASRASLNKKWDQGKASWRDKEKVMNREKGEDRAHKIVDRRALVDKEMNEVAMPQNQADWQALITHQIKTTGHPVATDAQFRATHGKDETKIASQEPPKDKLNYAAAQGGTVKR